MSFNLMRHIRIAGSVIILAGLFLSNWTLILLGNVVMAIGYMLSINKLEQYIEKVSRIKIETEDKDWRDK